MSGLFDPKRLPALIIETIISAALATAGLWVWNEITGGTLIRLIGGTVKWSTDTTKPGLPFNPDCEYRWFISTSVPMPSYEGQVPSRFYATTVTPEVLATSNGLRQFWISRLEPGVMRYTNKNQPDMNFVTGSVAAAVERRCQ